MDDTGIHNILSSAQHAAIGERAVERGWISLTAMCRRLAAVRDGDLAIAWLSDDGLNREQLDALLHEMLHPFDPEGDTDTHGVSTLTLMEVSEGDDMELRAFTRRFRDTDGYAQLERDFAGPPHTGDHEPLGPEEGVDPFQESTRTLVTVSTALLRRLDSHLELEQGDEPTTPVEASAFARAPTISRPVTDALRALKREEVHEPAPEIVDETDPFYARYVLGDELGQGGCGRVLRVHDRVLGREVAMKIVRSVEEGRLDQDLARFVAEAQTTGQLEHPNIVPIYDFGTLPTGEVFYTMREVRKHSLRQVFQELRHGNRQTEEEYNINRLVNILKQLCQAIHFAHVRGVIHRDLKPDNIMLGDYGEVLVMDWGLARVLGDQIRAEGAWRNDTAGQTLGTPAYMPPEQARGELGEVDELSDVYALGAILYEMLTLEPPFVSDTPLATMWKVVDGELPPPRERNPEREIPDELERICLRAMARNKAQRFATARTMHDALEQWLEGIQPREAARRVRTGRDAAAWYDALVAMSSSLEERVKSVETTIEGWEPIERKRTLWDLQDELHQVRADAARAFSDAVSAYTKALALMPDYPDARSGLADIYWRRFQRAESRGDQINTIYFKALLQDYDDGRYASLLEGHGTAHIHSEPEHAEVVLFRFDEHDRRLVPSRPQRLGHTPCHIDGLPLGSYLAQLRAPGRPLVRVPFVVQRGRDTALHVRMPSYDELVEGFVYIPGGDTIAGGDPDAFDPRPRHSRYVNSFFCATEPVTFRDYLAFIDALQKLDPAQALRRAPQLRRSDGMLAHFDETLGRWLPDAILIEGPARRRYPHGCGYEWDLPLIGVSFDDAIAYCHWRSQLEGRTYRLPTPVEWEKAARGVDGRTYSWGTRFDPTFCKMRVSRKEHPQLEPVGTFEADCSPYNVRDTSGGVQEWTLPDAPDARECTVKGGAWNLDQRPTRLASQLKILREARTAAIGFRLVYDERDD